MLTALHITVYPEDKVYAFPDPILGLGSTLKVYRAQLVVIMDGTSSQTVRTWVSTVGALIDEQQLAIGAKDEVSPSADTVLPTDGRTFTLAITRVAETDVTTFQDIAYDTQSQNDPDLLQGVQQVQQQGVPGQKKLVYHVRRENGVQVSKVLTSSDIVKQPVSKIVLVGTKPKVVYLTSGQYASYFNEAVDKYGVSADSLNKVMKCESGGNVNDVSANGRYFGLFQFDKQTWSTTDYGSRSIFDPEAQILAAASLWQGRSTAMRYWSRTSVPLISARAPACSSWKASSSTV